MSELFRILHGEGRIGIKEKSYAFLSKTTSNVCINKKGSKQRIGQSEISYSVTVI